MDKNITNLKQFQEMKIKFLNDKPKYAGCDTETTGLHIIKDNPFLIIFGWNEENIYTFEPKEEFKDIFLNMCKQVEKLWFHNATYDLHMLWNIGWNYEFNNVGDTKTLCRLTHEYVDDPRSLKLKQLALREIDEHANFYEKQVNKQITRLKNERNKCLKDAMKHIKKPNGNSYLLSEIDKYVDTKNLNFDIEDLPEEAQEIYYEWLLTYSEINYQNIDMETMLSYADRDVYFVLKLVEIKYPLLIERSQIEVFEMECDLIFPLLKMERVGINADMEYLQESQDKLRTYIKSKRDRLKFIMKDDAITIGRHQRIIDIYKDLWNITLVSADKSILDMVINHSDGAMPNDAKIASKLIKELRTLEKWYATYIVGLIDRVYQGKIYTSFDPSGTSTGRFSSNFQQFPKKGLKDDTGVELFHPRKVFRFTNASEYAGIFYFDWSQLELRVQADYTIEVMGGDINLCRAYMPYKGISKLTGEEFDHNDIIHLKRWNSGEWLIEGEPWTPTDVHGATTQQAFPDLDPNSSEFKEMRNAGKTVNFSKNYGAGLNALKNNSNLRNINEHEIEAIDKGYLKAFPGVRSYGQWVSKQLYANGYANNRYGRRYVMNKSYGFYKCNNYLIQGTGSDMLKEVIIKCDKLLEGTKSKMICNIHDELQFLIHNDDLHLLKKIKDIMEDFPWCKVPIVCDVEKTLTNWSEKFDVEVN